MHYISKYQKGIIIGIFGVLIGSTSPIFVKILLEDFTPTTIVPIAQIVSAIVLLFCYGLLPEIQKIHKKPIRDLFWIVVVSIFSAILAPLCLFSGLALTTATNATIIGTLETFFSIIIAFLWLKESLSSQQKWGGTLMFLGVLYIVTNGFSLDLEVNRGDLLILLSAVFWAFGNNLFKKFIPNISPELMVTCRNVIGTGVNFFIVPYILGVDHSDINLKNIQANWMYIVGLAVLPIVLAQMLWYKTLKTLSASVSSIIILTSPFFGVVLAMLILKEELLIHHLWGGVLVVAGLVTMMIHHHKHKKLSKHLHLFQCLRHHFH